MEIKNNKLVNDERLEAYQQTPNGGVRALTPDTIVIHYTAGGSSKAAVRVLTSSRAKVSAHLVVGRGGDITQLAKFNTQTWHAGRSSYRGRTGYNKYSIGIEIDNAGYLVENPKGEGYVTWFEANRSTPRPVDEDNIVWGVHRNGGRKKAWEKYPDACIQSVYDICEALVKEYNIKYIIGHEEIAPKRKLDPGPAFPLDDLREKILSVKKETIEVLDETTRLTGKIGEVNASSLNIRSKPKGDVVAKPLEKGQKVALLEEKDGWVKVKTEIIGWISKKYVETDNSDDDGDGVVTVDELNIRSSQSSKASKVADPLNKGKFVDILTQENNWFKVSTLIEGWVSKKYIKV